MSTVQPMQRRIRSLLVANRSEIAIRVMRAAAEMGIRTVAVYSHEDRLSLHRFKADESYVIGAGKSPTSAYLAIDDIIGVARQARVDAIHPGYGFLSENPDFAAACEAAGIIFVGPRPGVMRRLGNKVAARALAIAVGVPVVPATDALPRDLAAAQKLAAGVGYPLMLKASWGGGGRGMRVIESEADLAAYLDVARREALAAFGNDDLYLEKLIRRARHLEVQVLGDQHGNLVHLFERDCSVQRRNQKLVERAPAPAIAPELRDGLTDCALALARAVEYTHAGTVEFLIDVDTGAFYFIEVNPRIQVEHTVTEQITGVDIVKAQIRISEGARIGEADSYVPPQQAIAINGHALQCRITTEDPENGFTPDYGRITAYRSAAGFGVRLDGGTAYSGAVITPYYDSLLVKVTAWGHTEAEAIARMDRALREFRIRGVATNLQFLENVIAHPQFQSGECTTRFVDATPKLAQLRPRRDRATKLLRFIGEVTVNGNPEVKGRAEATNAAAGATATLTPPVLPAVDLSASVPPGTRDRLKALGAERFARWVGAQRAVLLTDTTLRDAHQSLFATRMRTHDMLAIAPYYARLAPDFFSLECWGGATFDVALRFLKEDPWERLARLREAIPNILFQMLLRGSNAVGYTNYADNVVRYFIAQAADAGVDLFRVFDSLNWVENMRVAIDAVRESGALCEGAICYTSDIFDPHRPKYSLKYYLQIGRELKRAGVHLLAIKDMAGVCRPRAAFALVKALKEELGLPVHFHTHDTSGISAASVLAAIEAGADVIDGALDAMSGLTSQPNLSAIAAALAGSERDPRVDRAVLRALSRYWEGVRTLYRPFESDIRAGTADVYVHEMPGGQYTNLREQARAMGLEARWPEVAAAYAEVNRLFGDIVKVTPTSKVVGDMALMMVANDLTAAEVEDPNFEIAFPESVVSLFKGELGFPPDGFPPALQKKVLKGEAPLAGRSGAFLPPVDLLAERVRAQDACATWKRPISEHDLASWLMYPKVFKDYTEHHARYGDVTVLPTTTFFFGMRDGEEITVEIEPGKALVIRLLGRAGPDQDGDYKVFFELNGQPRLIRIAKPGTASAAERRAAEAGNPNQIGSPMPGNVVRVSARPGQRVRKGDPLVSIEAMKLETMVCADRDAAVKHVYVKPGDTVNAKELLMEFGADCARDQG